MQIKRLLVQGVLSALLCASLSACSVTDTINSIPMPEAMGVQASVDEGLSKAQANFSPKVGDSALIKAGYLTVGIRSNGSAPFAYVDASGKGEGMDYYVSAALAQELGLKVQYVWVGAANVAGTSCDIVMDTKSSESGPFVVVGEYAETATAFFQKGNQNIVSAEDLTGKSVGLQSGSVSADALNRTSLSMNVKGYNNLNDVFSALNGGTVNFALSELYSGAYLATDYQDIHFVGALDTPRPIGIAVANTNEELQNAVSAALTTISTNGQLDIIKNIWVGGQTPVSADQQIANVGVNEAYQANATMAAGQN